jgi:PAS domain S-box-containing protein
MSEPLRILILEDNPADVELIEFELQEAGLIFASKAVMTENEYVQAIQDYYPELILSDYDLPNYNGSLALAEANRRCPDTPFILVSGAVTEDRAIEILTQGAKDYVLKTRLRQRLVPAVRRALAEAEEHRERKKAEAELREAHRTLEERVEIRTAELQAEVALRKGTEEALRNERLIADRLAEEMAIIAEIGKVISSSLHIDKIYERFASEVKRLIPFDRIVMSVINPQRDTRTIAYVTGIDVPGTRPGTRQGDSVPLAGSMSEEVICTREGLIIQSMSGEDMVARFPSLAPTVEAGIQSHMCVPLLIRNELVGTLIFQSVMADAYTAENLGTAQRIGAQIAGAVTNAQLYQWLETADKALRESEAHYRSLFDNMMEGFAYCRMLFDGDRPFDFIYLDVNSAFESLTGLKNTIGKKVSEVIPGIQESDPELFEIYGSVALTGEPVRFERYVNALQMWFSISVYSPEKEYFVAVFDVISERKRIEKELRESEEQFHALADSIPNLAWWANGDGYITWYNKRWYEYTGTIPKQMEGWGWQSVHDPKVLPEVLEKWKESIATGQPFDMEFPLRGADGVFRPFLTRVLPLKDTAGQVLRWFGTNTDISALRQTGKALEERTKQLEETNKELESFSYSVSHDLRAPLRAIDGYSRMILKQQGDKFDERTTRLFDVIRNNTKMMEQLIDDLLALSRLGGEALSLSRLNVDELTKDVWEELKANNPERPIDLTIDKLPPGIGDRSFIKQVLVNIISNAIKFTRSREVPLIGVGGYMEETECVYYVRDNGVGFDMRYHDKLFGVFQRLHSAADYEGTGIGLALVQRIIQRHGGRVWAESEPDKGATFYFSLPTQIGGGL